MGIFEAIILGVIQGLTEFLPVSSSGHLELAKTIFGDESVGQESMLMTVVLHFATALSTVVIFRKEILIIFKGLFQFKWNEHTQFSAKIILSMIPAALVGVVFKDEIESLFGGQIILVGSMLLLTGVLLFLADKAKNTEKEVGFMQALLIGISQAIAILPGISRSGATISTSVLLGIDREKAARFSFLMVVPLIFGAMAVDTKKFMDVNQIENLSEAERTTEIMVELEKDEIITPTESKLIHPVMFTKELDWSASKVKGETQSQSINDQFVSGLKEKGLSEEKIELIQEHELAQVRPLSKPGVAALSAGFIFAFLTGIFACTWMIGLVKRAKLKYFSFYCFAVGVIAIVWSII